MDAPCPRCGSLVWFPSPTARPKPIGAAKPGACSPAPSAPAVDFTLDDFRRLFEQLKKMGPMKDVLGQMPGMSEMIPDGEDPEQAFGRIRGMIDSMTKQERRNPDIIDTNRRRRIAAGSGIKPREITRFLGQFDQLRRLMQKMAKMSIWERIKLVVGF